MIIFLIPLFWRIFRKIFPPKMKKLTGKHVVITGGSSGIGKNVAILSAKRGAHVSIIARNVDKLKEAEEEIRKFTVNDQQRITSISADVSDFDVIQKKLLDLDKDVGPIYMLVNCAGMAICGEVENISVDDVETMIKANFLGTLYPIKVMVPLMKKRKDGIIVLTASQVALMGMYGYSVYSSCKFALRGLAESIRMELKPYNISVTLALPADTDTPGFENENKSKPEETKKISNAGGLLKPEVVAENLIQDTLMENFFSYVGMESFMLTTLCVGMSPFSSVMDILIQSCLLGPMRVIGAYYLWSFDRIIQKCYVAKTKKEKTS